MTSRAEPRCSSCGALVTPDAEWCGMCFTSLRPEPSGLPGGPIPRLSPKDTSLRREAPSGPNGSSGGDRPASVAGAPAADQAPAAEGATARDDSFAEIGSGAREEAAQVIPLRPFLEQTPGGGDAVTWTCPACGESNALSLDICRTCATPFRLLLQEPEVRPFVEPGIAVAMSLVLPGIGHARQGRIAEGVARAVMFFWALGTALMIYLSKPAAGLGPLSPMAVLFLLAAGGVYGLTAADAYRLAEGRSQILSSRILLYTSAALVILSVFSLGTVALRVSQVR